MKFEIPEKFQLFGKDYTVEYDQYLVNNNNALGMLYDDQTKIVLQSDTEGYKVTKDSMNQTFLHELVHAILFSMHKRDDGYNEEFVEVFSQLLYQAIKTAESPKTKSASRNIKQKEE